jgi:hypothetical protein
MTPPSASLSRTVPMNSTSLASAGGTHEFLQWLTARSQPLHCPVGMTVTQDIQDAILKVPAGS